MKKVLPLLAAAFLIAILVAGCGTTGSPRLSLIMTDANVPGLEEMWVTVSQIYLIPAGSEEAADDDAAVTVLSTAIQEIELIASRTNAVTLVNADAIPAGTYGQLRLVIDSARAKIDGEYHDVKVPSWTYKIILRDFNFASGGVYSVTLDFDVAKSLEETGGGNGYDYNLKPTCKAVLTNVAGWMTGTVVDAVDGTTPLVGAQVDIYEAGTTNLVSQTFTDSAGFFQANALVAGTYEVTISMTGYTSVNLTGQVVAAETATALGTISLIAAP